MIINHNMPAMNTYRQMGINQANGQKSMEKLSSGLRINRAGDDAAGLAISEKMRGQIRGLDQASRNSQDAISMIQTAEGALNETHSILQRMRELAVQASNDTNTTKDREEIQKEINQLTSEINRIGNTTEFNTQKLLNGDKSNSTIDNSARGFVNASGVLQSAASGITAGTNATVTLLQSGASKLAAGEYSLDITSTTTKTSGALTATISKATYAGLGAAGAPAFSGGTITIDNTALSAAFSGSNASGTIKLTRNADGSITVQISGSGGAAASGVDITDIITADASGNFSYNNHGVTFKITDVAGFDAGATMTVNVGSGSGSIQVQQQLWNSTTLSGTTSGTPGASNIHVSGDVAAVGTYTVSVIVDAAGGSGTIKISMVNPSGTTIDLDQYSGVAFTSGTAQDFAYSGHGIKFTLSGLDSFATGSTNTLKIEVAETTTYKADLKNASGTTVASGTIGTEKNGSGLTADANVTVGGVTIAVSGGKTLTSGTTNLSVRGIEQSQAKSGDSSLTFQIGANENQSMSLEISDMRANALGITRTAAAGSLSGFTSGLTVNNGTNNSGVEYALDVTSSKTAAAAVTIIQSAIDKVSAERSKLGAYQNRLEHTINNLGTASENLTASESRIRDVDMAKEVMANSRNNILAQAAQAMLAQANQAPQQVLSLLR